MNNVVTQRFMECVNLLKESNKVKSIRQFALSLGYVPQGLSEMSNGRRDVTIELLRKAIETYDLNPEYIFTGKGSKLKTGDALGDLRVLTVVTDADNNECIIHVPVAAQAGYTDHITDPEYINQLPTYTLPYDTFRSGSYRSFDVAGTSMEPTLHHGDKVVCSFIEPQYWQQAIKDGQVYVVVTNTDVLVKRLINRIRSNKCVDLVSDNRAYEITQYPVDEIRELWWVRLKLSPYLDQPSSQAQELEEQLERQSALLDKLTDTVSALMGGKRLSA